MIEFDVETDGLQWYVNHMFLAQFYSRDMGPAGAPWQSALVLPHPGDDYPDAIQLQLDKPDGYRAHNTKFDLHFLKSAGYTLPPEGLWHDGMVAAHVMDERYSAALQNRSDRVLGEENAGRDTEEAKDVWLAQERKDRQKASKDSGDKFVPPNYSDVPDDIMYPYGAHDAELQAMLGDVTGAALDRNPKLREVYDLEMRVLPALFWMERRGVGIDRPALGQLEASLLDALETQDERCIRITGFDNFNPGSPKQVSEALDRLGADVRFMERKGSGLLTTDEENLQACDHELAEAILARRGTHKMYAMVRRMLHGDESDEKFPHPYLGGDERLHPDIRQVGARHGRMSCANPNLQQIHRDDLRLRYCMQAAAGKKLVCCDLEAIEMRLLAAFAGDGVLLEAIKAGKDIHSMTATATGLTGRTRSTGAFEGPRDQGKRMNYLTIFGGGVKAMKKWFGIPAKEAKAVKARYMQTYPEVGLLLDRIEYRLHERGYIETPLGRRHRVYSQRNADREAYKFVNYLISGTAADIFKEATAKCHEAGIPLILAVHDELVAEVDEKEASEAARIIQQAMVDHPAIAEKVPIDAEAKIVDRWSQAKKPDYVPDYLED